MGTHGYGVQIVVEADHSDHAVELAMAVLAKAVEKSGLPSWPVVTVETIAEDEEMFSTWSRSDPPRFPGRDIPSKGRDCWRDGPRHSAPPCSP